MGGTSALQRARARRAGPPDGDRLRRLLPALRPAGEIVHLVGLPHGRLPPQHGAAHRPRAAHAGARGRRALVRDRRFPAAPRTPLRPRAGGVRAGARRMTSIAGAAEGERTARLRAYGVLDPDLAWPALDELVKRARDVGGFPIAWVSFIDERRERLGARAGVEFAHLGRDHSLAYALALPGEPRFIEDLASGPLRGHPLVADPGARFAAILPLTAANGFELGTLTVLELVPRPHDASTRTELAHLASLAMARLESRRETRARSPAPPSAQPSRPAGDADPAAALAREREFSGAVLDSLAGVFFLLSHEGAFVRWNTSLAA